MLLIGRVSKFQWMQQLSVFGNKPPNSQHDLTAASNARKLWRAFLEAEKFKFVFWIWIPWNHLNHFHVTSILNSMIPFSEDCSIKSVTFFVLHIYFWQQFFTECFVCGHWSNILLGIARQRHVWHRQRSAKESCDVIDPPNGKGILKRELTHPPRWKSILKIDPPRWEKYCHWSTLVEKVLYWPTHPGGKKLFWKENQIWKYIWQINLWREQMFSLETISLLLSPSIWK